MAAVTGYEFQGLVVDERIGAPVVDARVELWDSDGKSPVFVSRTTTDARGAFTLRFSSLDMPACTKTEVRVPVFRVYQNGQATPPSSDPVFRNFPPGITKVTLKVATLPVLPAVTYMPLQLSDVAFPVIGRVVTPAGHPMVGVKVEARMEGEIRDCGEAEPSLLGQATTDSRGRFQVRFLNHPAVLRYLRTLSLAQGATFSLRVLDEDTRTVLASAGSLRARSAFPVTLVAMLPTPENMDSLWAKAGPVLARERIAHLHQIASTLTATGEDKPFAMLSRSERAGLLADLEGAFLDPSGVLRRDGGPISFQTFTEKSAQEWAQERRLPTQEPATAKALAGLDEKLGRYGSLDEADWVLGLDVLSNEGPGPAILVAQENYAGDTDGSTPPWVPPSPSDRARYRNYLRAIFTGAHNSADYSERISALTRRLHQNFETLNDTDSPANALVVDTLKVILTAPVGNQYGFGIAAASIQPQGNRTVRQYLDYLVGLTGVPEEELSRRYRLDLSRGDDALSSPVRENITALQGFYRDGFQSKEDPSPVHSTKQVGRAPFFLYFEEWQQAQAPFFGENHFSLRDIFRVHMPASSRQHVRNLASAAKDKTLELLVAAMDIEDKLDEGWKKVDLGQYNLGLTRFQEAVRLANAAFWPKIIQKVTLVSGTEPVDFLKSYFQAAMQLKVSDADDLVALYRLLGVSTPPTNMEAVGFDALSEWAIEHEGNILFAMLHLCLWVGPALEAEIASLQGDFSRAAILLSSLTLDGVGRARSTDQAYKHTSVIPAPLMFAVEHLHGEGDLAYTLTVSPKDTTDGYLPGKDALYLDVYDSMRVYASRKLLNKVELRALQLRLCEALLGEAEARYRRDTEPDVGRARELYKAVLFIHKQMPAISPTWSGNAAPVWLAHEPNPAVTGQISRALAAFIQIEAGLNFYGFRDDLVPSLRYQPLKEMADRMAAAARNAQQDFLFYTGKVEESLKEELTIANLLQKAELQKSIAQEQEGIAQFGVLLAQQQVAQVQAAIEAKRKELEEHQEIVGQFKDFFGGMKDFATSLAGLGSEDDKKSVADGFAAGVGLATSSGSGAASMSALAAGGTVMAGFALFAYAGITTLQSMADAQLSRELQLKALKTTALPLAQAGVTAKAREITIAQLQQKVALADLQLAKSLLEFGSLRLLNIQAWSQLGAVAKRVLKRYLDLGGRFAWQAERALAYEQNRALNIIRLSYSPEKSNGLMGSDLLQADLAELDAARLLGQQRRVRTRRTFSLAFDFPMAFVTLKQTGRATFSTTELEMRAAHPGSTGWRIRSISTAAQSLEPKGGFRGLLTNLGFSQISQPSGEMRPLLRPAEGQPVGEAQPVHMREETLAPFEGSGVDTFWTLELPTAANPYGLGDLMDVLLILELEGDWSPARYVEDQAAPQTQVRRFVLLSAAKFAPQELASLKSGASSVTLNFDMTQMGLPDHETSRKVKNLAVAVAGASPENFTAPVGRTLPSPLVLAVPFNNGIAHSNAEPFNVPGVPAEVLNAFVGTSADQTFSITLGSTPCPGVDFSHVADVILAVEYEAKLT